jgi:hypothetical protein
MKQLSDDQKHVQEILRAYHTPVVLSPGGWGDDLPELWNGKVIQQRLEMIDNGGWDKATDIEVAMHLSSTSGAAPFNSDWTDIFVYEVSLVMGPEVYDRLDKRDRELTEYQKGEVNHLKHQIRDSQIKNEKKNKGGTMQKNKIVIEELEDGVLIGISKEKVDPFVKKLDLTFAQMLDQMPFVKGVMGFAEAQWNVSPRNPSYAGAPKTEAKKAEAKISPKKEKKTKKIVAEPMIQSPLPEPTVKLSEPQPVITKAPEKPEIKATKVEVNDTGIDHGPDIDKETAQIEAIDKELHPEGTSEINKLPPADGIRTNKPMPVRVSADAFQYRIKPGTGKTPDIGPFATVQEAMDALGIDKATRPTHNRYDRLSKKLREEIIQEKK